MLTINNEDSKLTSKKKWTVIVDSPFKNYNKN